MEDKQMNLTVSPSVLEDMASIAAKEVEGVAGLCGKAVDIKNIFDTGRLIRNAKVEEVAGTVNIDIYIKVKQNFNVKTVAAEVQQNVKEKIQNMTGSAVTNVNVTVADIEFAQNNDR